jgi:hypothetical protein
MLLCNEDYTCSLILGTHPEYQNDGIETSKPTEEGGLKTVYVWREDWKSVGTGLFHRTSNEQSPAVEQYFRKFSLTVVRNRSIKTQSSILALLSTLLSNVMKWVQRVRKVSKKLELRLHLKSLLSN